MRSKEEELGMERKPGMLGQTQRASLVKARCKKQDFLTNKPKIILEMVTEVWCELMLTHPHTHPTHPHTRKKG